MRDVANFYASMSNLDSIVDGGSLGHPRVYINLVCNCLSLCVNDFCIHIIFCRINPEHMHADTVSIRSGVMFDCLRSVNSCVN